MKDGTGVAGVAVPGVGSAVAGIFAEDTPAPPRQWQCQHCGKLIKRSVRASYNGAPLCLPARDSGEVNCYRLVSVLNHQMPCEGNPCPGAVLMDHHHEEDDAVQEEEEI